MLLKYIYILLLPAIPAIGALVCLFMIGLVRAEYERRLLKRILFIFFSCEIVIWGVTLIYNNAPEFFVSLSAFAYLAILLAQVSFFHFIFRITQSRENERFSFWHYAIPFIIAGIQEVWMLMVPYEVTLELVESKGVPSAEYPVYSFYFLFKVKMRMLYSIFYTIWALLRIYRYRKVVVNYSSDEERTPLTWLKVLVFLTLILVYLPLFMAFQERSYFFQIGFVLPVVVLLQSISYMLLCHNFVVGNYVQITQDVEEKTGSKGEMTNLSEQREDEDANVTYINRDKFEAYMCCRKPYLNSQLRIIDLAAELGTNRTYMSAFINATYGINFSQLINRYRMEEYHQLEKKHSELSKSELAVRAGFGSYRSFARITKNS